MSEQNLGNRSLPHSAEAYAIVREEIAKHDLKYVASSAGIEHYEGSKILMTVNFIDYTLSFTARGDNR